MAAEYEGNTGVSVTHAAINKHFKKLGVPRDLSAKIQAKAAAMVSAAMVSGKVSAETTATDAEIINKASVDVATVVISHRGAIRKRSTRDRWTRDLSAKIAAKTEAKLSRSILSKEISVKIAAKAEELVRRDAVRSSVRSDDAKVSAVAVS